MIVLLRFCPYCGGRLPEAGPVKYCPACGENLAAFAAPTSAVAPPTAAAAELPAATYAAALRRYDCFIADLEASNLDKDEIHRQAAEMFARLKAQFPTRPRHQPFAVRNAVSKAADEPWSIVLKACADPERLAGRLSGVLRRSPAATRLAVDMVPCVIVYKSKAADAQAAVRVLEGENLYYTVIKGDFTADAPAEKIIPGFAGLDSDLQLACLAAPAALWLGENVRLVAAARMDDAPAVVAVTDMALFYTTGPWGAGSVDWRIIPYARLAEIILHDAEEAIELIYRGTNRSEWLQLADERQRDLVYDHIRSVLAAGQPLS